MTINSLYFSTGILTHAPYKQELIVHVFAAWMLKFASECWAKCMHIFFVTNFLEGVQYTSFFPSVY